MKTKFISENGKMLFELKLSNILKHLEDTNKEIINISDPKLTLVPSPLGIGQRENYSCLIKYK